MCILLRYSLHGLTLHGLGFATLIYHFRMRTAQEGPALWRHEAQKVFLVIFFSCLALKFVCLFSYQHIKHDSSISSLGHRNQLMPNLFEIF